MDALTALTADKGAVGSTAFDDELGRVVVQAFDARAGLAVLDVDPADVLYAPEWNQTLDVVNRVVLGYGYGAGTVTVDEPVSQGMFGIRWTGLFDSGLADAATASARASVWLDRLAYPRWHLPEVTLLKRYPLAIGERLNLTQLPSSAPLEAWTPVIEGWVDTIEGELWTQDVIVSDPIFSSLALRWQEVTAGLAWQGVDPLCRWFDATSIAALTP